MFHWSPSISKPCMPPVSLVETTDSYKVCRMDYMRFAGWVTIWVVHLLEQTETGRSKYCIGQDYAKLVNNVNWK